MLSCTFSKPHTSVGSLCGCQVDLLRKMMAYDPAERITAVQSVRHEFFNPPAADKPEGENGSAALDNAKP